MWPITKPFPWRQREGKKQKTGGRRERESKSLPCLQPFVHRHLRPMTGPREGKKEIHWKKRKNHEYSKRIIDWESQRRLYCMLSRPVPVAHPVPTMAGWIIKKHHPASPSQKCRISFSSNYLANLFSQRSAPLHYTLTRLLIRFCSDGSYLFWAFPFG